MTFFLVVAESFAGRPASSMSPFDGKQWSMDVDVD